MSVVAAGLPATLRDLAFADIAAGRTHGMQVFVAKDGHIVLNEAIGVRGQDDEPLTVSTPMAMYSTSKPFTATALHLLVDRGLIAYDDPVARFIPEYAINGKESTTVDHLLTHRAGIPQWSTTIPFSAYHDHTEAVRLLCALVPEYAPGTSSIYHPLSAYTLVAEIVQRVAGEPFAAFCEREVFVPLGLSDTTWGLAAARASQASDTVGVDPESERLSLDWRSPETRAAVIASGGLHSTAADLGAFFQAWLDNITDRGRGLLTTETARLACHRGVDLSPTVGWGYGFWVGFAGQHDGRGTKLSERAFGHPGLHSVQALADPDSSLVICLVSNVNPGREASDRRFDAWCDVIADGVRQ